MLYPKCDGLEQCHYPHDTHFCNFIHLLDNLIDSKEDVELLVGKGILQNHVGDPKALAEMINKLMINIEVNESCFIDIVDEVEKHYKNTWNNTKASLRMVYFNNLWRGTSTIAAVYFNANHMFCLPTKPSSKVICLPYFPFCQTLGDYKAIITPFKNIAVTCDND